LVEDILSLPAIFRCRFPVVATLAQRLPVRLIPEKSTGAFARKNVVNYGGNPDPADPFAFDAERMSV
jgi:hypothetical protein